MKNTIIGIVVIVVIVGIIYLISPKTQTVPTTAPEVTTQTAQAASAQVPKTVQVEIKNMSFIPSTIKINPGDTIMWTNNDETAHSIVFDDKNLMKSKTLQKGDTFGFAYATPGTLTYHCGIHSSMKGSIVVSK
ncbi:MAG: cupredoxin domain-containing protein [Minisyncoccia bacterium]